MRDAPMPTRTPGLGLHPYETMVQLKSIVGGLGAAALGAWAFWVGGHQDTEA
jgi:hypothetical protein